MGMRLLKKTIEFLKELSNNKEGNMILSSFLWIENINR
ncbi:hypothetical protein B4102_1925 [Heyndrickxia sporothermodurans]|uniref:Uncharacterized protein n=1 Tax=Heyndrickxia sporothermodurans TaxID=46224 RepID=A0A150LB24_9BACI|nr:hypothetical protein B4102_1925 [Heyndrickxia sporothermodurans]